MTNNLSNGGQTLVPGDKTRWVHVATLGAVCTLVLGIYVWSAQSGMGELWGSGAADSYYNLLVQGFREGQLNLKREAPPGLVKLADPYDPPANLPYRWIPRYPLDELSYFRGKLYLYFGATPALVLFWPYAALTGHYLLHKDAVVVFFSLGFLAGVGLLWALWRRHFTEVHFGAVVAGTLALGLANFIPAILRRSDVWEVAVSCGYALTMLALVALWCALHQPARRGWWLAGASLAYGLALGARPSLLPGALVLLVPVAKAWCDKQRLWPLLMAAIGPIALIGIGLMLYNALRFDHPLEFGQSYQLLPSRQDTMQQFSLRYLWFNFRVGFWEPARWCGRFPFVQDIAVPPLPRGGSVENAFGVLTNIPLVWLALAAPLAWRNRLAEARSMLRWFFAAVALLFATCAVTLGLHNSMCLRYEVEFAAPLVLLAVAGILGLERTLASRPVWQGAIRWVGLLLLFASLAFNLLASLARQVETENALGMVRFAEGRSHEAVSHYQNALKLQPDNVRAHHNLGTTLFSLGRGQEAVDHLAYVIKVEPGNAEAYYNLGLALFQLGRLAEAIQHLEQALQLNPGDGEAHYNLGVALFQQGQVPEAVRHYERALQLLPDFARAYYNLGVALSRLGRVPEAIKRYEQALHLQPDAANARINLAWALATCGEASVRDGPRAVKLAETANEVAGGKDAGVMDTLAAAYAESGRFDDAVRTSERGAALARAAGNQELAALIESRLKHYREGRPFHAISERPRP